jgi:MFS superfamily sulfate permease-like transporter
LLDGVGIGIAVKAALHIYHGAPISSLFTPDIEVTEPDRSTTLVTVKNAADFSTWIGLRRMILSIAADRSDILDLSATQFVDHTVMEKLQELEMDFDQKHRKLVIIGLESHQGRSKHPHAAQIRTDFSSPPLSEKWRFFSFFPLPKPSFRGMILPWVAATYATGHDKPRGDWHWLSSRSG